MLNSKEPETKIQPLMSQDLLKCPSVDFEGFVHFLVDFSGGLEDWDEWSSEDDEALILLSDEHIKSCEDHETEKELEHMALCRQYSVDALKARHKELIADGDKCEKARAQLNDHRTFLNYYRILRKIIMNFENRCKETDPPKKIIDEYNAWKDEICSYVEAIKEAKWTHEYKTTETKFAELVKQVSETYNS